MRIFGFSVELGLLSVSTVVGVSLDADMLVISVDVVAGSAVNGKHEVVLKQKFPSMTSVKNPKRDMSVSASRESCCSQLTPMNSYCGNNEAK